ncbi:hypothetical protein MMC10_001480 [Thelotrema lepadinum]|nr:hypothetical protein [Thelotrema lepadinum]
MLNWPPLFNNIQLDIVGFLAILGEASVDANAQVTALSKFSYLPRLVPAPQALIRHDRPERLRPLESARVVSSHSGNSRDQLNHVASIIHDIGTRLDDYTVRVIELKRSKKRENAEEKYGKERHEPKKEPIVSSSSTGPLTLLAVLGTSMSLTLLIVSIVQEDGMSLLATLILSAVSSIIGIGSRWKLKLPRREVTRPVPESDVIIKFPQGAFIVVKCSEEIQRELYWHPEKCDYIVPLPYYRYISLVATLFLMAGVIFLANATILLQVLWAGAYVILNAAYWIVAALPEKHHWDLSAYEARELTIEGAPEKRSFTHALWTVIAVTGSSDWAWDFDLAPKSPAWKLWLSEALGKVEIAGAHRGGTKSETIKLPQWNAIKRLSEIFAEEKEKRDISQAV